MKAQLMSQSAPHCVLALNMIKISSQFRLTTDSLRGFLNPARSLPGTKTHRTFPAGLYTACFPKYSQKTPHSWPDRASYGVSFVSSSDVWFMTDIAALYASSVMIHCALMKPNCRVMWGKTPTLRIHAHILITNWWNSMKLIHNQIRL